MKKLLSLLAMVALLLPSCQKINDRIDGLENRIDQIEGTQIASLQQQIDAINVTLPELKQMDTELGEYIAALQETATVLGQEIDEANAEIAVVEEALDKAIADAEASNDALKADLVEQLKSAKADVLAQLQSAKTELENELTQINSTIATLQAKDAELGEKISDLETYVNDELKNTEDWATATFATLEQYNSISADIATIKVQIESLNTSISELEDRLNGKIATDIATAVEGLQGEFATAVTDITTSYTAAISTAKEEITAAYTEAIATAIANLELSMKEWVNEQFTGYYTIAEIDATLNALQKSLDESNEALANDITELSEKVDAMKAELTEAYNSAIDEAISTNNGIIDSKIASSIAEVNGRIDSEVAAINARISALEVRINDLEQDIEYLLSRIQSISYIPKYSDGRATLRYIQDEGYLSLDFEVSPKDVLPKLIDNWESVLSVKAVCTETRAIDFVAMPIISFDADADNGVISIVVSGDNLLAQYDVGDIGASVAMVISDGNNSVISEYVPICFEEATDELWYTSTDGNVVTPYATDVFGANIVSNTYMDGRGVIKFDGTVTQIGYKAFFQRWTLNSLAMPNSITKIGDQAFDQSHISNITLSLNTEEIGSWVFANTYLQNIHIPNSIVSIGDSIFTNANRLESFTGKFASSDNKCLIIENKLRYFAGFGLEEYSLPEGIDIIGAGAFSSFTNLKKIIISDGVSTIGQDAFYNCSSLTNITIPNSVTVIEAYAFNNCTSLQSISLPEGVEEISHCTFYNCESLLTVNIPYGVSTIGASAFYHCTSLADITIPDSVRIIGDNAFSGCTSFSDIIIPNSVNEIGYRAFFGCSNLKTVSFPDKVTDIWDTAFEGCSSLEKFSGAYASNDGRCLIFEEYNNCIVGFALSGLTEYTLPDETKRIGAYCDSNTLNTLIIPESVYEIVSNAFINCNNLSTIYCRAVTPPTFHDLATHPFAENVSERKIYVPMESVDAYKSAYGWSNYADYIVGYDF